jgi:hypothetical protein
MDIECFVACMCSHERIDNCFKNVVILFVWMPPQCPTTKVVRVKCHLASFWRIYQHLVFEDMYVCVCGIVLLIGITIVVESEFYELGD